MAPVVAQAVLVALVALGAADPEAADRVVVARAALAVDPAAVLVVADAAAAAADVVAAALAVPADFADRTPTRGMAASRITGRTMR